jgi:DNA-binding GntR family transcriptional regulator
LAVVGRADTQDSREPLADIVAERLRDAIISGELRPGERIRQEAIAEEVGTSRIPVREALNRLKDEGLVTLTSHVGARVAQLDREELDEIYLIREQLEPFAIERSAPELRRSQLDQLRAYTVEMEKCADAEDPSRWVDLDRRFHLLSYRGANLPRLLTLIESLWNSTQQYRRLYTRLPDSYTVAHVEHRLILDALDRGDGAGARLLIILHIRGARLALDRHTELFDDQPERA